MMNKNIKAGRRLNLFPDEQLRSYRPAAAYVIATLCDRLRFKSTDLKDAETAPKQAVSEGLR